MHREKRQFYQFGPFRLDPEERVLMRDGAPIPLRPKVTDTLCLLVENAGHDLGYRRGQRGQDLPQRIWAGFLKVIEETTLSSSSVL